MSKKIIVFLALFILLSSFPFFYSFAESPYSVESLNKLTVDELSQLIENANAVLKEKERSSELKSNLLIDDGVIRAEFVEFDDQPTLQAFYLKMHIINKTKDTITLGLTDASVDKTTMQLIMTGVPFTILPGEEGYGSFIFTYVQAGIKSINDFSQVSFKIDVRDDNMKTVEVTEKVTIMK